MLLTQTVAAPPSGLRECRACGRTGDAPWETVADSPIQLWPTVQEPPHPVLDLEIHLCRHCGHTQLQSMTPELVGRFYEGGSFVEDNSAGHQARLAALTGRYGESVLDGATVLDVGGGNNPFVGLLQRSTRWVSDISVSAAAKSQSDHWVEGVFEQSDLPDATFDVITAFHTLEHFPAPARAVERMAGVIKPGGIALIEVPNFAGYVRQLPHYAVFHQHQSYFNAASLDALMQRYGFALEARFREDIVLLAAYRHTGRPALPEQPAGMAAEDILQDRSRRVGMLGQWLDTETTGFERIAVYGAGGSTTMLLTLYPDLRRKLTAVFDRDAAKQGRLVPTTAVRVSAPEDIARSDAEIILFLSSAVYRAKASGLHCPALDIGAFIDSMAAA